MSCCLEPPGGLLVSSARDPSQTNERRTSGGGAQAMVVFKSPQVIPEGQRLERGVGRQGRMQRLRSRVRHPGCPPPTAPPPISSLCFALMQPECELSGASVLTRFFPPGLVVPEEWVLGIGVPVSVTSALLSFPAPLGDRAVAPPSPPAPVPSLLSSTVHLPRRRRHDPR